MVWADNCLAWVVSCSCGYIQPLWWAADFNSRETVEGLIKMGWDPFRDRHKNPRGLVLAPNPVD